MPYLVVMIFLNVLPPQRSFPRRSSLGKKQRTFTKSNYIKTPNNTFWVHGNATEHMAEYVIKQANSGHSLGSTKLDSQIILSDMHASLSEVTKGGIKYNTPLQHGNWEFIIKKSNNSEKYDAVIHAMYKK